jgi:excisionase family DNA binding protein
MRSTHPLTLTVEQAGQVLGVGRSTAYELAASGELKCIRLRRRMVVPVAHVAERLGVDHEAVWAALAEVATPEPPSPPRAAESRPSTRPPRPGAASQTPSLF